MVGLYDAHSMMLTLWRLLYGVDEESVINGHSMLVALWRSLYGDHSIMVALRFSLFGNYTTALILWWENLFKCYNYDTAFLPNFLFI